MRILLYIFLLLGALGFTSEDFQALYPGYKAYSEVSWMTTHNSFANKQDGWRYAEQTLSIQNQLEFGVRGFMLDVYWYKRSSSTEPYIALCHENSDFKNVADGRLGDCPATLLLGPLDRHPRPLKEVLEIYKEWLETHPDDIITLFLENGLGAQGAGSLEKLMQETDLEKYIYRKSSQESWPTLGAMRALNKRLIIFSDSAFDGFLSDAEYRETRYSLSKHPNCEMLREGEQSLFLLNHFYEVSPRSHLIYGITNSYYSVIRRVRICHIDQKRIPNFIAVDFVEMGANGGLKQVIWELNNGIH